MVMDICVRGSDAVLTYWKNAWNTPTVSRPATSMPPAIMPMITSAIRPRKRIAGPAALVSESAIVLVRASSSAAARISAALACSRPNALMTARPL